MSPAAWKLPSSKDATFGCEGEPEGEIRTSRVASCRGLRGGERLIGAGEIQPSEEKDCRTCDTGKGVLGKLGSSAGVERAESSLHVGVGGLLDNGWTMGVSGAGGSS